MAILVGALLVLLSVGVSNAAPEAICSNAAVIYCDNFDDRPVGPVSVSMPSLGGKTLGWGVDNTGGQAVVNTGCFSGPNCFSQIYFAVGSGSGGDNGGGGFIGTNPISSVRTFFIRMWVKYPTNWVVSPIASKMLIPEGTGIRTYVEQIGTDWPAFASDGGSPNLSPNMNVSSSGLRLGQWQCVEAQITAQSAAGVNDGAYLAWVNDPLGGPDIQVANYPNIGLISVGTARFSDWLVSAYWNCLNSVCNSSSSNFHPQMERLVDNVVISTARIGCGFSSQPTPPGTPANLAVN